MGDDREIMADQEKGHARITLEIAHQIEGLRLHRDIERRHRLVGDDEPWPGNERPRDGDALALAAGKLMRMLQGVRSLEAHRLERRRHPRPALGPRRPPERGQRLRDNPLDPLARIERAVGVLKDHLHLRAHGAQFARREVEQRATVKPHDARVRPVERQRDPRQRRFAGARFADDAERTPVLY